MDHTFSECPDWLVTELKRKGGSVTFAEFMDIALNNPNHGSYSSGSLKIGPQGDFVTSPSLGPDFSELLSSQIIDWFNQLFRTHSNCNKFSLVDIGPGEGDLSFHLLKAIERISPEMLKKVELILIEPNLGMRNKQQDKLSSISNLSIRWSSLKELEDKPIIGIMIANELLDALPVDRLIFNNNKLFMQTIKLINYNEKYFIDFSKVPIPNDIELELSNARDELGINIPPKNTPEGWSTEWHSSLNSWFELASNSIKDGALLVIDYILSSEKYYSLTRREGTIVGYSKQNICMNILENVGLIDITSHLCFETILYNAERNKWNYLGSCKQGEALLSLGLSQRLNSLQRLPVSELSLALTSRESMLRLVDPMCLGNFTWIVFYKNNENLISSLDEQILFLKEPI